jgi:transcriptional regulator NrdR family protein
MICSQCGGHRYRAVITNNLLDDQTLRKRQCVSCEHVWFTVEMAVDSAAIGWDQGKPVLRRAQQLNPAIVKNCNNEPGSTAGSAL